MTLAAARLRGVTLPIGMIVAAATIRVMTVLATALRSVTLVTGAARAATLIRVMLLAATIIKVMLLAATIIKVTLFAVTLIARMFNGKRTQLKHWCHQKIHFRLISHHDLYIRQTVN